jgi:hypothetical protein
VTGMVEKGVAFEIRTDPLFAGLWMTGRFRHVAEEKSRVQCGKIEVNDERGTGV